MVMDLAELTKKSVRVQPQATPGGNPGSWIINIATTADEFPTWGQTPAMRDTKLRTFWPTEPVFASALGSTIMRYAAFGWRLNGGPRTVRMVSNMLHSVQYGKGWIPFTQLILNDLFTQDNGSFIETPRARPDDPLAPVVSMNHLDSSRCVRTGNTDTPVYYMDLQGRTHAMRYYDVITLEEMPSPDERFYGMQYCVLTRMLQAARVARDIALYKQEKLSGRYHRSIHLVSGVQGPTIDNAIAQQQAVYNARGNQRYITPAIIASLDPTARISHEQIDLASLPDGFDEEISAKWYINQCALAFGGDYQDYAPLPGGNLGTAQQSEVLHLKSRGKGAALFMRLLEQRFNKHGIMPNNVTFSFGEQDVVENIEVAKLQLMRAQTRATQIGSGEITPEIARQMALDTGDLELAYLEMLGETNATPDEIINSSM